MRFVLSMTHPLRRFWTEFFRLAERFYTRFVPVRFKRIYWIAVSNVPPVTAYALIYGLLPLVGIHYMRAAVTATVVSWAIYFPIVRHRAFDGSGEVKKEGVALLLMYLLATIVQLKLLNYIVEAWEWHYIAAIVAASAVVSSVRLPFTLVIFLWRQLK